VFSPLNPDRSGQKCHPPRQFRESLSIRHDDMDPIIADPSAQRTQVHGELHISATEALNEFRFKT
jgi:hypothetical protein